jgi:chromate transporter
MSARSMALSTFYFLLSNFYFPPPFDTFPAMQEDATRGPDSKLPPLKVRLREIALLFLRLGFTAFGGPAAHIAMIEDEVVRRRRWIDRQHFLDLIAAINFIPGPNSTELAIQIGYIRAGFAGLVTAGVCFIVPAVLIILPIAWGYVHYARLPQVQGMLLGVNAVVVAIVANACFRFAQSGIKSRFTLIVALIATVIDGALQRHPRLQPELIVLAGAALAGAWWQLRSRTGGASAGALPLAGAPLRHLFLMTASSAGASAGLLQMAGLFLKIGATLFGSGYVLVSYLQSGVVDHYHWLTQQQLVDAVAVGQFTPGPLLTTATFVGYLRGQQLFGSTGGAVLGAVVATAAIFAPSFVFVALLGPLLPRIRRNPLARGAFDAMNAAVAALIAVVAVRLASALWSHPASANALTLPLFLLTLVALLRWKVNATWMILLGAVAGWFVSAMVSH